MVMQIESNTTNRKCKEYAHISLVDHCLTGCDIIHTLVEIYNVLEELCSFIFRVERWSNGDKGM
jgi:hypothetical protein